MSKYSAKYWKDRAAEIRALRDKMRSEEPRRIMAEIAADFDRLHNWTLIDVLVPSPFSAATRDREPKECAPGRPLGAKEQK